MAANVKAIRLHNPDEVWWGSNDDVIEHGNGTIVVGETPSDAAKSIGIYNVSTVRKPLGYLSNGEFIGTGGYQLAHENVPWQSTPQLLNRSVTNYKPLQNRTLFDMTDKLAEYLQLEGVGMLGYSGEITFVQFRLHTYDVGGNPNEQHNAWLLFGDDKLKGGAIGHEASTRVVCQNTWARSIHNIEPLPHSDDLQLYLQYIVNFYHIAAKQAAETETILNQLFTHKLSKGDLNKGLKHIIPDVKPGRNLRTLAALTHTDLAALVETPEPVTDDLELQATIDREVERYSNDLTRVEDRRSAIADAFFSFNDQSPYAADTAYAFFNAITDVTSHGETLTKVSTGRPLFHNDNGVGQVYGERAKIAERGWKYVTSLVK